MSSSSLIFMQYLDDKLLSHPINYIIYFIYCQVLANMVFMRYIIKLYEFVKNRIHQEVLGVKFYVLC